MLPNDVTTLLWLLIFFVIFYLYIDIRITKLRKELLSHYSICENMISTGLKNGGGHAGHAGHVGNAEPVRLIAVNEDINGNGAYDSFTEIIPTREETAFGLQNLKCTSAGCDGMSWLADSTTTIGSGVHPNGIEAFNMDNTVSFAPFNA